VAYIGHGARHVSPEHNRKLAIAWVTFAASPGTEVPSTPSVFLVTVAGRLAGKRAQRPPTVPHGRLAFSPAARHMRNHHRITVHVNHLCIRVHGTSSVMN